MIDPYRMVFINLFSGLFVGLGIIIFRFFYPRKKINMFYLVIIISLLPLISLLRKGTYESGDLTLHSVFLQAFVDSLKEGILIPRWAGGLCGGYGCPVFLFEYTLPFYLGSLFHFSGFSFINSIKLVLASTFVLSGIGMYLFAKNELNEKAAFMSSLLYLFAPFHLIEMHFRVGFGMHVAFTIVPFLFLFAQQLAKTKKLRYFFLLEIFSMFLILSHSTITIFILPLLVLYSFFIWKRPWSVLLSVIMGILLCSFYWLPAIHEVKYTWTQKAFVITDFKPVQDYLFSPTFYGFLFQGHYGELRLVIGYTHLLTVLLLVVMLFKKKKHVKNKTLIVFSLISFLVFFFLLLKISKPIWENTPFLKTSILPWRALLPIAFITSFSSGLLVKNISHKGFYVFLCVVVIGSTILNWGNRKPIPEDINAYTTHWSLYTEYIEQGNKLFEDNFKKKDGLYPQLVLNRPKSPMEIIKGKGSYKQTLRTSTHHQYVVKADTNIVVKDNTFYFPGWKIFANYKELPIKYSDPQNLGIITYDLKKGLYRTDVIFADTPIRKISKWISIATLTGAVIVLTFLSLKRLI